MSLNRVFLIGNLGADPEKRFLGSGSAVANFNIATTAKWTDKGSGEKKERTEWHRIVVYGQQAEHCSQYLSKGKQVFVEGEVRYRSYEDKTGQTRYITEIIAQRVQFLGGRPDAGQSQQAPHSAPDPFPAADSAMDDVPF